MLLINRYQTLRELGQGGMGTVYLAQDTYLEGEVAVKMLNGQKLGTTGRTLLINEARAAARLSHPNVTMVFDVGEQDDVPFIVMEYVEGQTLAQARPSRMDNELIMHLLQKKPQARPESAREVGRLLGVLSKLSRMASLFEIRT